MTPLKGPIKKPWRMVDFQSGRLIPLFTAVYLRNGMVIDIWIEHQHLKQLLYLHFITHHMWLSKSWWFLFE